MKASQAPGLSLSLLGGFQARLGSGVPLTLSNKAQALLAYLAAEPGRRHARDKLATLLWAGNWVLGRALQVDVTSAAERPRRSTARP